MLSLLLRAVIIGIDAGQQALLMVTFTVGENCALENSETKSNKKNNVVFIVGAVECKNIEMPLFLVIKNIN